MLELHRYQIHPEDRFSSMMFANKAMSLARVLEWQVRVDLTAILREGDSMINLENYLLSGGTENLENYAKFWKLYNINLRQAQSFMIQTWFRRCWRGEPLNIIEPV